MIYCDMQFTQWQVFVNIPISGCLYIFLHMKLLGKGIQEKLRSNNIVSIKYTFLAN